LIVLSARSVASANGVSLHGPLPFTPAELDDAVTLRLEARAGALPVDVAAAGNDQVRVTIGGKMRLVSLGGLTGPGAARRVSIAIADLSDEASLLPAPARRVDRGGSISLALMPVATMGSELRGGVTLSASWRRLFIDVGWTGAPSNTVDRVDVSSDLWLVRAGLTMRAGTRWLLIRGGPALYGHRLTGAAGERDLGRIELIPAAGLSVAAHARFGDWSLFAAAGVDGLFRRNVYTVHGTEAIATDRVVGWAGAGIAWWVP
jgi:hypothetical protein